MDVQCDRCKTEYEFDDALVSGRGTTVRCTNCGHQFKVRQAGGTASSDDRWTIRTSDGEQVTFLTLRDLQQAILSRQIRRADALLRGAASPRPLGSITELDPFFEGRMSSHPPPFDAAATEGVVTAPIAFPKAIPWPREAADAVALERTARAVSTAKTTEPYGSLSLASPAAAPRPNVDTLRPASTDAMPPPPAVEPWPSPTPAAVRPQPPPEDVEVSWDPAQRVAAAAEARRLLPPPTQPMRRPVSGFEDDSFGPRQGPPSSGDDSYPAPRRRTVGGWIVAFVLLLAVGVVGWALAKPYFVTRDSGATKELDPRLASLLSHGERALADGRLDVAQGDFDKASVLAERDSRVLLDEARVAAAEGDVPWLKLRLLPAEAVDEIRTAKAQLAEIVARARRFSDDALTSAPQDVPSVRAKMDALRLADDRDAARAYVPRVIGQASQPETAYVLAALDLGEPVPLWTTIIERLRLAAGAESYAGRAQAALIYALAKSGDGVGAKLELAKLDVLARPYPLLPSLHDFVDKGVLATAAPASASSPRADPSSKPPATRGAGPALVPAATAAGAASVPASDPRLALQSAALALRRADFNAARQIYQSVVDRNPTDSEAIAGLGDVARLQGDSNGALGAYRRAIAVNPSYLPALLGLADTEWEGGDRASAAKTYGEIVDRFPEGTYPRYVPQRAGERPSSASSASPGPSTASPSSPGASNERTE